jgi:D-xylose transport system ATP-binding protein
VTVLRLGSNAGTFPMADTTQEQIVEAITGASDNVVARREQRVVRERPATPEPGEGP